MLGLAGGQWPLLLLALASLGAGGRPCPTTLHNCKCVEERAKPGLGSPSAVRKKMVCSNEDLLEPPDPSMMPNRTVTLVLSNNKITVLRNASFFGLQALEKLDLKNNLISTLEHDVFMGLAELKRLDLSNNRIGCLTAAVFRGLVSLTRLNLSGNIFSSLTPGTFDELPSLKQVDFATDYLTCDCNLRWVVSWSKNSSALISDRTLCVYPGLLHDQPLRGLKERHLTCMGTPELHTHQLIPSLRQVVFQGDRLPFECSASYLDNSTQIQWYHNREPVEEDDEIGIILEDSIIHDCTIISSELILSNIDSSANGEWECTVFNTHGNVSKKVEIVVLETSASYCPAEKAINNRGEFRWPRTVAGIMVYQPCLQYPFPSVNANGGTQDKRAARRCDRSGSWEEGDYSKCLYTNDITRVLYTFVLMPINASNALTLAHQLRVYTAEAANFSDMMDVIYVAQMIAKFIGYVDQIKQLGEVIVEMASNIMLVDGHILWMAQEEDKACTSIVQSVEKIAGLTLSSNSQDLSLHSRNIALEAFLIKPESYVGLSCTAFQRRDGRSHRHELQEGTRKEQATEQHPDQKLKFRCTTGRSNSSMENLRIKHSVPLASIQLPETLFSTPASSSMPEECKLQFVVFRNGKFFHSTGNSSGLADNGKRRSVSTPVVYAGIHGCSGGNLSDPVLVSLRHLVEGGDPVAAYWNFELLEGNGGWSSHGCQLAREEVNITTIHCWHLNNFAVLKELNNFPNVTHCAAELPHSVIYTCTAVLLLCLFATIITYIVNHSTIHISRKGWHMVLNLCFHIAMTSAVFAGGITLSNYLSICQVVGIVLHYSTLATLLWMGVKARVIYKDMNRKPHLPQEGEVPQPAHRPMLRFYLIAGGIPLIICGITAAVNINNPRENHSYCLVWQPSLAAFYAPAAVILLVTWIYFLCTGIALKRRPAEQKEPLEHGESLTRLGGGTGSNPLSDSGSLSASPASQNLDADSVHSLKVQFWALLITHCLYIALWGFGALAVSQSWYYSVMFSCLYGVVAVALGLFVFIHHCVRRPDVMAACCPSYRHTLPMQGYVHPGIIVDDTSQVFMGCSPEVANSVKSSSSLCSSNHSTPGHCKLTNLQVVQNQAEICPQKPACYEEPQPVINKNSTIPSRYTNNLHGRRNHKSRTKQYREGKHHRLKVLRGPSSDQPSSESGSLQNSHTESYQSSRNSPLNNGSTGGATRDPDGTLTPSEGSDTSGQQPLNAQATDGSPGQSSSRDNLKQANSMERDSKRRSYPVNMGSQNGTLKGSKYDMNLTSADSSNGMKTGLWKSETTV